MFLPGQIVWDLDAKMPMKCDDPWNPDMLRHRLTHFIKHVEVKNILKGLWLTYELALPKTIEEAQDLMHKNIITPAPLPPTHFWKCRNWVSNHEKGVCICHDRRDQKL